MPQHDKYSSLHTFRTATTVYVVYWVLLVKYVYFTATTHLVKTFKFLIPLPVCLFVSVSLSLSLSLIITHYCEEYPKKYSNINKDR